MAKPLSEEEVDKFQNFCMKFEQSMDKAFLREAFKIMDRDGNGTVNAAELKALMMAVEKKPVSDKQVNDAIKKVDKNGDGLIDLNEFIESILDQMAN